MVRLDPLLVIVILPDDQSFNPTLVRLDRCAIRCIYERADTLSIPLWFDWTQVEGLVEEGVGMLSIPLWFDWTAAGRPGGDEASIAFQSHFGSIGPKGIF